MLTDWFIRSWFINTYVHYDEEIIWRRAGNEEIQLPHLLTEESPPPHTYQAWQSWLAAGSSGRPGLAAASTTGEAWPTESQTGGRQTGGRAGRESERQEDRWVGFTVKQTDRRAKRETEWHTVTQRQMVWVKTEEITHSSHEYDTELILTRKHFTVQN